MARQSDFGGPLRGARVSGAAVGEAGAAPEEAITGRWIALRSDVSAT